MKYDAEGLFKNVHKTLKVCHSSAFADKIGQIR